MTEGMYSSYIQLMPTPDIVFESERCGYQDTPRSKIGANNRVNCRTDSRRKKSIKKSRQRNKRAKKARRR